MEVSTFHHSRCVCVYVPSSVLGQQYLTAASAAMIGTCSGSHPLSKDGECCCLPPHTSRDAVGSVHLP